MHKLTAKLQSAHPAIFVIYAASAAFMTYFCMYALRKPYTVAGYEGMASPLEGLDFKICLILSQIFGYMLAKFIGVKVIAEMTNNRRAVTLVAMVLAGELALILFAVTPAPYSVVWLFFNGLSLGMIWGLVFGYLEGRRTTEILGAVLAVTFIVASGMVRTVGRYLMLEIEVPDQWMPAATGAIFLLPLMLSVFLLSKVPLPSKEDEASRQHREPMDSKARLRFFLRFAPGIVFLLVSFLLFTGFRDFRDNFSAELWTALGYGEEPAIFAYAGVRIAFFVLFALAAMVLIKNNTKAFFANHGFILFGCLLMAVSTWQFQAANLDGKSWMVVLGAGLYIAYIPYNCFLFDRMIAAVGVTANVGFLLYLADSAGYVGSVSMMLYRVLAEPELSWLNFFIYLTYWVSAVAALLVCGSWVYFKRKVNRTTHAATAAQATI